MMYSLCIFASPLSQISAVSNTRFFSLFIELKNSGGESLPPGDHENKTMMYSTNLQNLTDLGELKFYIVHYFKVSDFVIFAQPSKIFLFEILRVDRM